MSAGYEEPSDHEEHAVDSLLAEREMDTHFDALPWVVYRGPVLTDRGPRVVVFDCPLPPAQHGPHVRGVLFIVIVDPGQARLETRPAYMLGPIRVPGQPCDPKIGLSLLSVEDALADAAKALGLIP